MWFWFTFPWWLLMFSSFSGTCWPSACHLWRNAYLAPLPIFFFYPFLNQISCVFFSPSIDLCEFLCILSTHPSSDIWFTTIFSCLFSLCWSFPLLCRSFLVWCSHICLFLLLLPLFLVSNTKKKNHCQEQCHGTCFHLGILWFWVLCLSHWSILSWILGIVLSSVHF